MRDRRALANAALLRSLKVLFYQPVTPPRRRLPRRPRQQPEAPIEVVSDASKDILPPAQQPVIVDLDSSVESLPNIDPRPQWQLLVGPLQDLGPLDVTAELAPQLWSQTFREAYVLIQRMQLPPLQPLTPPPEFPPPEQDEDWVELDAAVAGFDGHQYILLAQPLALQQPQVAPVPEHVPVGHQPPQPLQQTDYAAIASALFYIAEREHEA